PKLISTKAIIRGNQVQTPIAVKVAGGIDTPPIAVIEGTRRPRSTSIHQRVRKLPVPGMPPQDVGAAVTIEITGTNNLPTRRMETDSRPLEPRSDTPAELVFTRTGID